MNKILKAENENIKKLKQLDKILDNNFIDFIDRYLNLDKTKRPILAFLLGVHDFYLYKILQLEYFLH